MSCVSSLRTRPPDMEALLVARFALVHFNSKTCKTEATPEVTYPRGPFLKGMLFWPLSTWEKSTPEIWIRFALATTQTPHLNRRAPLPAQQFREDQLP